MGRKAESSSENKNANQRDARLKAALKANMARRKAQMRARQGKAVEPDGDTPGLQSTGDANTDNQKR